MNFIQRLVAGKLIKNLKKDGQNLRNTINDLQFSLKRSEEVVYSTRARIQTLEDDNLRIGAELTLCQGEFTTLAENALALSNENSELTSENMKLKEKSIRKKKIA